MLCAYSIGAPIGAGQISREKHSQPVQFILHVHRKLFLIYSEFTGIQFMRIVGLTSCAHGLCHFKTKQLNHGQQKQNASSNSLVLNRRIVITELFSKAIWDYYFSGQMMSPLIIYYIFDLKKVTMEPIPGLDRNSAHILQLNTRKVVWLYSYITIQQSLLHCQVPIYLQLTN